MIVGGGQVALRRAQALIDAGAHVTVIAPEPDAKLALLAVELHSRPYRQGDLDGASLVVIASDDPQVNQSAARDAHKAGALVNRADDPPAGDFTVPAHAHHGLVTLAVHTGGVSAGAAAAIRRELSEALDHDWPRLIKAAGGFRSIIQKRYTNPDQRRSRLLQLTDAHAMAILKEKGEPALLDFFRGLVEPTPDAASPQPSPGPADMPG